MQLVAKITKIMGTIARFLHGLVRIAAFRGSAIHARKHVITAEVRNKIYLERAYKI